MYMYVTCTIYTCSRVHRRARACAAAPRVRRDPYATYLVAAVHTQRVCVLAIHSAMVRHRRVESSLLRLAVVALLRGDSASSRTQP